MSKLLDLMINFGWLNERKFHSNYGRRFRVTEGGSLALSILVNPLNFQGNLMYFVNICLLSGQESTKLFRNCHLTNCSFFFESFVEKKQKNVKTLITTRPLASDSLPFQVRNESEVRIPNVAV